uniref:Prenyltransferase n=1 Tax=candidate division WOR-3 bacterium TaxID=2052148 RepID=A0A7C4TB27_UNCW3
MNRILRAWLFGSRPYIALHYLFPTALGIFIGMHKFDRPLYLLPSVFLFLAIFFSYQASIVINDINDIKSDEFSKRKTPLNSGEIKVEEYRNWGIVFVAIALALGLLIGYRMFLIILLGNVLHFLYSSPPFRLKRFYPISILLISIGALLTAIAGYALYEPAKPFLSFPLKSTLFIVIPLFFGLNFRDLADYEGDRKTEVQTLFTIFGLNKGRIINAFLILFSYLIVPIILGYPLLFIATLPLGICSMLFCLKKPFKEKSIFYCYYILIIILTIIFNLNPEIVIE